MFPSLYQLTRILLRKRPSKVWGYRFVFTLEIVGLISLPFGAWALFEEHKAREEERAFRHQEEYHRIQTRVADAWKVMNDPNSFTISRVNSLSYLKSKLTDEKYDAGFDYVNLSGLNLNGFEQYVGYKTDFNNLISGLSFYCSAFENIDLHRIKIEDLNIFQSNISNSYLNIIGDTNAQNWQMGIQYGYSHNSYYSGSGVGIGFANMDMRGSVFDSTEFIEFVISDSIIDDVIIIMKDLPEDWHFSTIQNSCIINENNPPTVITYNRETRETQRIQLNVDKCENNHLIEKIEKEFRSCRNRVHAEEIDYNTKELSEKGVPHHIIRIINPNTTDHSRFGITFE